MTHGALIEENAALREEVKRLRSALGLSRQRKPLTRRQVEVFEFVRDHIETKGYAPSLEEIGRRFGLSSLATVHKHLANLQERGYIVRRWNHSRSIEIPT